MNAQQNIHTIVIGTSLTPASDGVVRAGFDLARAVAAKAVLVHAFQAPPAYATTGGAPYVPDVVLDDTIRAEREKAFRRLAAQVERLSLAEELADRRVEYGPPHRVITQVAEEVAADLVVVGSTESVGMIARMFGSTADRVVRKATRPVLMIHDHLELPLQRVLLPVDLSPLSAEAFRRGLDFLAQVAPGPDVELEALYVQKDQDESIIERSGVLHLDQIELETESGRELRRFVADNTVRGGRRVEIRVAYGEVGETIRTRSVDWESDLIVLGTHGRGGFERFLLGSVASDLVRHGATSVLVIPPLAVARDEAPLLAEETAVLA